MTSVERGSRSRTGSGPTSRLVIRRCPSICGHAPIDAAARKLLIAAVSEVLHELSEREQEVVRLRFGLDDGRPRTLEEVGRQFGVTRERIRQIEAKTLAKLRHPHRSDHLRDYLESS